MNDTTNTIPPLIPRRKPLAARVGVFGVGHHTYWGQFPGLREELQGKQRTLTDKLKRFGVEVLDFGLVDKAPEAYALLPKLQAADLDLLFCDMVTYATSSTFGVLARSVNVPIVLVALQPMAAMDYANGSTYMQLCNDDFCSVPEFSGVAIRLGRPAPPVVLGMLENDPVADRELGQWCQIAKVLHDLRRARLGHMGHVLESMLDMHTDPTAVTAAFGCHVVQTEADEVLAQLQGLPEHAPEVSAKRELILSFFDTPDPQSDPVTTRLTEADLTMAARAAVALDRFIAEKQLDGLAYYYEGAPDSELRKLVSSFIVGNSLLTAAGFPMCGEFDIKTCIAMMILDRLDIGGSFAEFHPVDFVRDTVLVGHDGPHHLNIADGRPVLRSLKKYHGKPGSGASVEFSLKTGPITMLSIGMNAHGRFKFVIAEGESLKGPIPPTGNTNTHGRFQPDVRTFLKRWVAEGPTHHFALGIGHHAQTIQQLAGVLGIESAIVSQK
ncbi:MAG: L-fucose/L-arabinose isomerase family protein [Verrucomicrobiota bacterium]